ncbi:histidine phosphatase family protein [Marinomonas transparens]|uniref:Histidine phosphatase family protein n=1 Tax=Marinomonas transparens TaxID=2795388 RepID=A0A934JYZ9_9GAMM|nr:histidine phosphatase family protein [Marinomonas transparens]MBJ7539704.1 histidine phosphatase family protein [Marinomonas transparens]
MKLYLVRHPKPDVIKGLCYGDRDVPLADGWQVPAQSLKKALSKDGDGASMTYYHSPLSRAAQLAEFISDGQSVVVDALTELDFGEWEGLCWQDIPKQEIDLWMEDIVHSAPYHGESLQVVADRVWQWWLSIKDNPTEACVVVAHSGVIKVFVSLLCQWPLAQCHRIDVGFNSLTELYVQGDFVTLKRLGAGDWVLP